MQLQTLIALLATCTSLTLAGPVSNAGAGLKTEAGAEMIRYWQSVLEDSERQALDLDKPEKASSLSLDALAHVLDRREPFIKVINVESDHYMPPGLHLTEFEAVHLAQIVKPQVHIEALILENQPIGDNGMAAFADAMKGKELAYLKLQRNRMGPEGALAWARLLKEQSSLEVLEVVNNFIGDEGVMELAKALLHHPNLEILILDNIGISNSGAKAVAQVLPQLKNLKSLSIINDEINDEGAMAVIDAIKSVDKMKTLDLSEGRLSEDVVLALQDAQRRLIEPVRMLSLKERKLRNKAQPLPVRMKAGWNRFLLKISPWRPPNPYDE